MRKKNWPKKNIRAEKNWAEKKLGRKKLFKKKLGWKKNLGQKKLDQKNIGLYMPALPLLKSIEKLLWKIWAEKKLGWKKIGPKKYLSDATVNVSSSFVNNYKNKPESFQPNFSRLWEVRQIHLKKAFCSQKATSNLTQVFLDKTVSADKPLLPKGLFWPSLIKFDQVWSSLDRSDSKKSKIKHSFYHSYKCDNFLKQQF